MDPLYSSVLYAFRNSALQHTSNNKSARLYAAAAECTRACCATNTACDHLKPPPGLIQHGKGGELASKDRERATAADPD